MSMDTRVRVAGGLLRLLGRTWRQRWENVPRLEEARRLSPGGNVIYAIWHNALATLAWTHRHQDIQVLVSHHDDGEWIARILQTLGYGLVRGSSRRGGLEALYRLAAELEDGRDVAITVDGPLGPRFDVHPGVLLLARRTGRPIVPVLATPHRRWVLGTWDALRVPQPGARVVLQHGVPSWIDPKTPASELETHRRTLQEQMHRMTREEETRLGHAVELVDVQDHRTVWERCSESPHPGAILRLLEGLYAAGAWLDRRLRPRRRGRGERPWVVGIGNLEAGGTGKTPVLLRLVEAWTQRGVRCGVLTRGHGGTLGRRQPVEVRSEAIPQEASDETRLMRQALPEQVPLIVSRQKHRGLPLLARDPSLDIVVVDDALQTARLPIDRHLILLDAQQPLANGHRVPAGRLREAPGAVARGDVLLFTRSEDGQPPDHPLWRDRTPSCFVAREEAAGFLRLDGSVLHAESLRGKGIATLCGLGKPQAFERLVRRLGARYGFSVRRCVRVPDHGDPQHRLGKLLDRLASIGCDAVVLTRKDACRLGPRPNDEPLLVLEQRLEIEAMDSVLRLLAPPAYSSA